MHKIHNKIIIFTHTWNIYLQIYSSNYQWISIKREEFNELSNNNFTSIQGRNSASNDPKNEENKQQASQIDSKYKSDMNLNQNQTISRHLIFANNTIIGLQ